MSRNASGTYTQPANTSAVSGATIGSAAFNTLITDVGTEITNSIDRGGRSPATANIPMGGFKITGVADPTLAQDAATKNYVDSNTWSTGDVKLTIKTVADSGWLMCNDTTIGNAGSGATYSNAAAQSLYTLLWNNVSNTYAPVTGGRGASAAADWSGLKPIALTKMLGRALGISGAGSGLTARSLGQTLGEENHTLSAAELATHTHGFSGTSAGQSNSHTHLYQSLSTSVFSGGGSTAATSYSGSNSVQTTLNDVDHTHAFSGNTDTGAGVAGTAHNTMQPTSFLNAMIKL